MTRDELEATIRDYIRQHVRPIYGWTPKVTYIDLERQTITVRWTLTRKDEPADK